ncbi:hypothetical protein [Halapricum hydrolyticum]|uniref:Uncharacterized protein n=1 Tax=Halapricum hydrolyticum TaxID=2979991 RepID=A0AAE3IA01_9EURY|nr:hypothetical protein [Halapricum hydrolyticum]MCU4717476.1 hypothetical protein [Halapricum hydrolyticum]MCU4726640.1 hypothetical protein [Halapricum hydrolyticum]
MAAEIDVNDTSSSGSPIWDAIAGCLLLLLITLILLRVDSIILATAVCIGLLFYAPKYISRIQYDGIDSQIIAGYYVSLLAFVFFY